jgi:hypothetical protein
VYYLSVFVVSGKYVVPHEGETSYDLKGGFKMSLKQLTLIDKLTGKSFNPLLLLMSLGAGGIAVIPFAFLQYTMNHGKGLVDISDIAHGNLPLMQEVLYRSLEAVMIVFTLIHFVSTVILLKGLFRFIKSEGYGEFINDPLKNAGILAPFISIVMTMNVFIGPIRYFSPFLAENLQSLMLPALLFWSFIWILLMRMELKLLNISFTKSFDVSKISFGWLLHPFALGMLTVVGTGIAALSKNASIAHIAAFMSLVTGTMGFFLLIVKLFSIFKSHFAAPGLPEKQFLPSFLIVIPNITLYAISAFRLGHYLEHHHAVYLGPFFKIIMTVAFAFETWYLLFGLTLLKDYFKKHFFKKEFYVSQWGFVCPVVAYAVLGSFVYKVFLPSTLLYVAVVATLASAVALFWLLFIRQGKCAGILKASVQGS